MFGHGCGALDKYMVPAVLTCALTRIRDSTLRSAALQCTLIRAACYNQQNTVIAFTSVLSGSVRYSKSAACAMYGRLLPFTLCPREARLLCIV